MGKYRIDRRIGEGGFAVVYQATDTIEGIRVALKIPHTNSVTKDLLERFRQEVRLAASLDHPNIVSLKNAEFIDDHFVVAFPLAEGSLADRLRHRITIRKALDISEQMLSGVAHAHEHNVIHCDIKPENLLLNKHGEVVLTDFGLAKSAMQTVTASGSGTVGYIAPEQAVGKPSFRSDVFSMGLVMYRMLAGQLPGWPYDWPSPGYERLRRLVHPNMIEVIRRAIELNPRKRYADGSQMLAAFQRAKPKALRFKQAQAKRRKPGSDSTIRDWRIVRQKQFQRQFSRTLETREQCTKCDGPVAESMLHCPWCGTSRKVHRGDTKFPGQCRRCNRGMKKDWKYCAWCYGPGFEVETNREYTDRRYSARCANAGCSRKLLMPFMRYCPWCRAKVRRKWPVPGSADKCGSCGWGVVKSYWVHCPWCGDSL